MDPKGLIIMIVDLVVVTTLYSWAICRQIDQEEDQEKE
jgi:hypothetical protein